MEPGTEQPPIGASHEPWSRLVVVGGSAGGIEALVQLVAGLPADFPAPVCVVLHLGSGPSVLPRIPDRAGPLRSSAARDGEPRESGRIYVSVPNRHLTVDGRQVRVSLGPREDNHRPAVDPLFRSAARSHGHRAIGVVVSGALDCGAFGLLAIERSGGVAVVQSPGDALVASMPEAALTRVPTGHQAPAAELGPLLDRLVRAPPPFPPEVVRPPAEPNVLSGLMCPDCSGPLSESDEAGALRFQCRTGHAFGLLALLQLRNLSIESTLRAAANALEEKAQVAGRLARRSRERGQARMGESVGGTGGRRGSSRRPAAGAPPERASRRPCDRAARGDRLTRAVRPFDREMEPVPGARTD